VIKDEKDRMTFLLAIELSMKMRKSSVNGLEGQRLVIDLNSRGMYNIMFKYFYSFI
jgi:hypothetical protein